jgi:hypothetical protein
MNKPARRQVTRQVETHAAHEMDYNIWYGKYMSEDKDILKQRALTRCNIATDAGYTSGDKAKNSRVCLFFARGSCVQVLLYFDIYSKIREVNVITCIILQQKRMRKDKI